MEAEAAPSALLLAVEVVEAEAAPAALLLVVEVAEAEAAPAALLLAVQVVERLPAPLAAVVGLMLATQREAVAVLAPSAVAPGLTYGNGRANVKVRLFDKVKFNILARFRQLKDPIISTLALVNATLPTLTPADWDVVTESCDVLKPFDEVTVEISSENSVSVSKVIIMAKGLLKITTTLKRNTTVPLSVINMLSVMQTSTSRRFHNIEYQALLAEASLLDPRFKKRVFTDDRAAEETVRTITAAAGRMSVASSGTTEPTTETRDNETQTATQAQTAMFRKDFDDRVSHLV
ncbi:UNVERIFIED_CONTAM: hypothetical protein FKN15_059132 [Acipenser sinensis]